MKLSRKLALFARRALLALLACYALLLLALNGYLASDAPARALCAQQPQAALRYQRAWMLWPGRLHLRAVQLQLHTPEAQLQLTAEALSARISLAALRARTLQIEALTLHAARISAQARADPAPALCDAAADEPAWALALHDAHVLGDELTMHSLQLKAPWQLRGALSRSATGEIAQLHAALQIERGALLRGAQPLGSVAPCALQLSQEPAAQSWLLQSDVCSLHTDAGSASGRLRALALPAAQRLSVSVHDAQLALREAPEAPIALRSFDVSLHVRDGAWQLEKSAAQLDLPALAGLWRWQKLAGTLSGRAALSWSLARQKDGHLQGKARILLGPWRYRHGDVALESQRNDDELTLHLSANAALAVLAASAQLSRIEVRMQQLSLALGHSHAGGWLRGQLTPSKNSLKLGHFQLHSGHSALLLAPLGTARSGNFLQDAGITMARRLLRGESLQLRGEYALDARGLGLQLRSLRAGALSLRGRARHDGQTLRLALLAQLAALRFGVQRNAAGFQLVPLADEAWLARAAP